MAKRKRATCQVCGARRICSVRFIAEGWDGYEVARKKVVCDVCHKELKEEG